MRSKCQKQLNDIASTIRFNNICLIPKIDEKTQHANSSFPHNNRQHLRPLHFALLPTHNPSSPHNLRPVNPPHDLHLTQQTKSPRLGLPDLVLCHVHLSHPLLTILHHHRIYRACLLRFGLTRKGKPQFEVRTHDCRITHLAHSLDLGTQLNLLLCQFFAADLLPTLFLRDVLEIKHHLHLQIPEIPHSLAQ